MQRRRQTSSSTAIQIYYPKWADSACWGVTVKTGIRELLGFKAERNIQAVASGGTSQTGLTSAASAVVNNAGQARAAVPESRTRTPLGSRRVLLLEGVETKAQKCQRGTQNDFGGQRLSRSGDIIAGWERTSGIKESMGRSWCQVGNIAQRCFENHGTECVAAKISRFFCRAERGGGYRKTSTAWVLA